jgi:VanZ family protein
MTVHERRADRAAFLALCGLGGSRALGFITATYTLLLVFATHYPKPEHFLGTHAFSDKVLHFAAYVLLASLAAATLAECRRWGGRGVLALAWSLAAFAAIDEITQPLFGRSAEGLDWVFDCMGIAVGILAVAVAVRLWRRPTHQ